MLIALGWCDSSESSPSAESAPTDSSCPDEHYSEIKFEDDEIPPSIYFGGCSFGAGFCKSLIFPLFPINPLSAAFPPFPALPLPSPTLPALTILIFSDVGVHMAMVERWGPDFHKHVLWSGGSAGTVWALGLAMGKDVEEMNRLYKMVAARSNRHGAVYYASLFMEEAIRELITDPQAFKTLQGRCCIGTTTFFDKHRWHVSWADNEDLIACVKASCHIPFYCQANTGMKGTLVVDGAYGFAGKGHVVCCCVLCCVAPFAE